MFTAGCVRCTGSPSGPHLKSCGCPCASDGCKHAAPWAIQDYATRAQRFLRELREYHGCVAVPRLRAHYRWIARWWELEAMRGYESSDRSREYAANYRWLVELMDAGRRVTADVHGVYIDGELASKVQERTQRAERRQQKRAEAARKESERPDKSADRQTSR